MKGPRWKCQVCKVPVSRPHAKDCPNNYMTVEEAKRYAERHFTKKSAENGE